MSIYFCNSKEELLTRIPTDRRVIIIIDKSVDLIYGEIFKDFSKIVVNSTEQEKSFIGIQTITQQLLSLEADRSTFLVAVGGGTLTDLAGFVASIYMRGIDFGFIPTTLLAQVDASIGGKTAINFEGYKNILGVFQQPAFTLISSIFLNSLTQKEIKEGLAEMLKTFLIKDEKLFFDTVSKVSKSLDENEKISTSSLEDLPYKCALIKNDIVTVDPLEKGDRILLNLGHTFAHALEKEIQISHGEAVAIGITMAAKLSVKLGLLSKKEEETIFKSIASCGLTGKSPVEISKLVEHMKRDKKRDNRTIRFVVLNKIGQASIYNIPIDSLKVIMNDLNKY